jgi:hypothetical protein
MAGFKNYTQEDGLNSSFGYRIKQDPKGFIWIGGDNGLFRFDGVEFKQYNEKLGFKNIEIIGCEPLANGEIFIIPFLNVNGYLKNNKLYTTENNPELKKLQFGTVLPLVLGNDSMNQLFMTSTLNPVSVFIYKNEKVSEFPVPLNDTSGGNYSLCFLYDFHTSDLYYVNNSQVMACNIRTRKKTRCNIRVENHLFLYSKGRFFVTKQGNAITVYELVAPFTFKKLNSFDVPEKVYQVFIDNSNKLWVCLENGGALYFDQVLNDTMTRAGPVKFLEDYMVNDILRDRDGNIWFNTKNSGVFFLSDKAFKNYAHLPVKNNASYLTAVAANKTAVFLGHNTSKASIYRSGKLTELILDKDNKFDCRGVFANEQVVIFGQSGNGYIMDLSNHHIESLLSIPSVKNIIPYTPSSVLISTSHTLFEYNFVTRKETIFLSEKTYTALLYHPDSLFVGSFKDLYKVNVKNKTKTLFLEGYFFNDLKKIDDNMYAAATRLNGILLFNNSRILRKITKQDGLASEQIKKIAVENTHTIWAATSLGLTRISLEGNSPVIRNFTRIDGLPSDRVSDCVIKNDTIYVATSKGLGIFSIRELLSQDASTGKEVIINAVSYGGGNELFNPKQPFTATYPDNTVIFDLSFLDYTSQGKISYRYKTEGLNEDWQVSKSSRIILNSLPPGKYTFRVYGLGYNGRQSDHDTAFSFEIKPRFWQSGLFYALVIVALTGVLILLVTYVVKKRRDKKLKALLYEKKIAELELQAIKAQINPHFIYNCLNSIQYLLYKRDYEKTENYLDRFSQMIRKTLVYSEKTFITIQEEMEYLVFYLDMEKLRFKGNFSYVIHVAGNVNKNWKIPSLMIQPFVENAIKHGVRKLQGREGMIEIRFEYSGQQLSISIRDNGAGISDKALLSKPSDSFGIKLSRKRVEAFRQLFDTDMTIEIHDLSEKGQHGTEIKLHLNLPHEH